GIDAGVLEAEFRFELEELLHLGGIEGAEGADLFGQEQNSRVSINDFELVISLFEVGMKADDAMGLEENGVGVFDVGKDRFAEALIDWGDVFGCFYVTEEHFGFGMIASGEIDAGDGEVSGVRGMIVKQ